MKEVHNHYATLPYRNTLACRTTTNSTGMPLLVDNVFLYGLGLSPTVTPVASVCGKERPYKLYHIEDNCENNVASPALVAKTFPCYLALLTASY